MRFQTFIIVGTTEATSQENLKLLKNTDPRFSLNSPDSQIIKPEKKHISLDQVRILKKQIFQKPFNQGLKAVIIKEAHMLTIQAQNALLKVLEEPPAKAIIILNCLEKNSLLPTILSRSIIINAQKISTTKEESFSPIYDKNFKSILEDISYVEDYEQWIDYQIRSHHKKLLDSLKNKNSHSVNISRHIDSFVEAKKMIQANVSPKFVLYNLVFSLHTELNSK